MVLDVVIAVAAFLGGLAVGYGYRTYLAAKLPKQTREIDEWVAERKE